MLHLAEAALKSWIVRSEKARHIIVCGPTLPELVCCFKTSAEDVAYP